MSKIILILLSLITSHAKSQNPTICIPYGNAVQIDGNFNHTEWQNSDSINLGSQGTKVYYKHDSTNLLFAFVGNLQSASRIPEIMIDANNDKQSEWQPDDWWFHISAKDCDYQGQYGNYDSCAKVRPNWLAEKNVAEGQPQPPFVDTMEISIPFNTLNIELKDTFGISFLSTNLFSIWENWPQNADRLNPSSWANAILDCDSEINSINIKNKLESIKLYPNPSQGQLKVKFSESLNFVNGKVKIINASGKVLQVYEYKSHNADEINLNIKSLINGVYFVLIESKELFIKEKFIIEN